MFSENIDKRTRDLLELAHTLRYTYKSRQILCGPWVI